MNNARLSEIKKFADAGYQPTVGDTKALLEMIVAQSKLAHDMMVLLCDAAQRLHNAADGMPVSAESAAEISDGINRLSARWLSAVVGI